MPSTRTSATGEPRQRRPDLCGRKDHELEEIFVPALGMAMEEATLLEWLKQPGDTITPGDPIAVIETDKSTIEIEAESAGILGAHLYEAGTAVPVGTPITHVLEATDLEPE
jgi:pyruvate dehydrogenase E2 component (dihydrolipoamide acetyltransferase)